MKWNSILTGFIIALLFIPFLLVYSSDTIAPATPNLSKEAYALLEVFYNISGKYILTGQHNYPNTRDRNSQYAAEYTGKTPVIWSTDWGHAREGDSDSYLARPDIVDEAIRQHKLGSIVTICWHAVPPTADEPVTFRPLPGSSPDSLASVQGHLLDRQFRDILTPGTVLYNRWCAQVDSVAVYLKKLQDAHVPVLWRPYHEMNGDWFWWGGRQREYSTRALYIQLFDRLINYHKLNNLIWEWSVDRPNNPEMQFSNFYPGNEYLDILALDVYRNDFNKAYYDSLLALADGKPIVLGEVGNPPASEILTEQPDWAYYVIWAGMVRNTLKKQYDILLSDPRVLSREDTAYCKIIAPYRAVCGLPPLTPKKASPEDFTGTWIFNEEKSILDNNGASNIPCKLEINLTKNELIIQCTNIIEYADNTVTKEVLPLDGTEVHSGFWNSPKITTAFFSEKGDSLNINSKVTFSWDNQTMEAITKEKWTIEKYGKSLSIKQYSLSPWGERNITMVFNKETNLPCLKNE